MIRRGLLALLLAASVAGAQDNTPPPQQPRAEVNVWGGAMRFAERGSTDKMDFVWRGTVSVPVPSDITLWGRADWTRTQDGGNLFDIKTFKSIEAFAGGRKTIAPNLSVTAFSGVTWNRDDKFEPTDARLWTAAVGLRYVVPRRGYVVAAVGHHGPTGGSTFLGSVVYTLSDNSAWFADAAVPLDSARFELRPVTVKFGVSVRLHSWNF